jgi:ADP-heptose:LPS heptosyltransferase
VRIAEDRHEVEVFLDQLRADGLPVDDAHNENWVSAATAAKVEALLDAVEDGGRPRVFIAPKSTCWEKQWPLDRLAAVIARLVEEQGCECFLCGGPGDAATHQTLRQLLGPEPASHLHDFSSSLNLRETGGLLARMDLCLGIDTGLLHIAASFGVPVVALFGPTNPNQWRPWGTPCEVIRSPRVMHSRPHRLREVNAASSRNSRWPRVEASMDDIGIEEVMAGIYRLLAPRLCQPRAR